MPLWLRIISLWTSFWIGTRRLALTTQLLGRIIGSVLVLDCGDFIMMGEVLSEIVAMFFE